MSRIILVIAVACCIGSIACERAHEGWDPNSLAEKTHAANCERAAQKYMSLFTHTELPRVEYNKRDRARMMARGHMRRIRQQCLAHKMDPNCILHTNHFDKAYRCFE